MVRRVLLYLAVMLALPCAANAEQFRTADVTPAAARTLDLSFDPAVAVEDFAPSSPEAAIAPPADARDRAFSLGVKIKARPEVGSPAARATAQPQDPETLTEKVEGIVERSSIGVTGTYRF